MKRLNNAIWFTLGILVCILATTLLIPAFASTGHKQATLNYNNIKITLDQKEIIPKDGNGNPVEPFIIDGTTYLPLRGIANALGLGVNWDPSTGTVALTTGGATMDSPVANSTYNRNNPAPIGTTQTTIYSGLSTNYTADICIKESIRGEKAWEMIYDAWRLNDEAKDGYEYIVVKIAFAAKSVEEDKSISVNGYNFKPFSAGNSEYTDRASVVGPNPKLSGELYSGASTEGWYTFMVLKTDNAPKVVYNANYDGSGGIWFSLT